MASDPIIKAEHLTLLLTPTSRRGTAPVLDGHQPGDRSRVLRGHSGAQRLRQIHPGQALQRHAAAPTAAKLWVDGMDTGDEENLLDIRRTVGMVFQNPDNQIVANVVEEDVAFAPGKPGRAPGGDPPAGGRRPQGGGHV